ncbi:TPA: hypothetical protein ACIVAT_000644 [Salmonella enterica subsp. enterica serovar Waycross]
MSYINAADEFNDHVRDTGCEVTCAKLSFGDDSYAWIDAELHTLKCGYSLSEFASFINGISQEYDNGYGGQNLFGTIWYSDGTWSSRGEYDGSEWWEHNKRPEIDEDLK